MCMSQRRMCARVAHIAQGSAAYTAVLSSGLAGGEKKGGEEQKTSGAQLHWLSY